MGLDCYLDATLTYAPPASDQPESARRDWEVLVRLAAPDTGHTGGDITVTRTAVRWHKAPYVFEWFADRIEGDADEPTSWPVYEETLRDFVAAAQGTRPFPGAPDDAETRQVLRDSSNAVLALLSDARITRMDLLFVAAW